MNIALKNPDRRAKRSRRAMESALLELLASFKLSEITVARIADKADVNRRTFYLHYKSVEDLLENIIRIQMMDLEDELSDELLSFPIDYDALQSFLSRHVELQGDNLELIVNSGAEHVMNAVLETVMRKIYRKALVENGLSISDDVKLDYIAGFTIGACIGLLNKWIKRGRVESPEEVVSISIELLKPFFEFKDRYAGANSG